MKWESCWELPRGRWAVGAYADPVRLIWRDRSGKRVRVEKDEIKRTAKLTVRSALCMRSRFRRAGDADCAAVLGGAS